MTGLIDTLLIQARHKWHIRTSPQNNSPKKHSKGTIHSSHKTQLHWSSLAPPQTSGDKNQLSERLKSAGDAKITDQKRIDIQEFIPTETTTTKHQLRSNN